MKGKLTLQSLGHKSMLYLKRYSPTILTCMGAIGVVATSVMAVKSTPKAMKLLEEAENEKGETLTKLEVVKITAPVYIPAVIVGVSTISCIFGANLLNKRHQASIASAYAMLNQSYQQYRKAANSVYGEDADSKIRAQMAKDTYIHADGYALYDTEFDQSSEKALFYDIFSQRYFTSTIPAVMQAQYHLNRNFILRGRASVNEFYDFLGVSKITNGDDIGWGDDLIESGIMWIDFKNEHVKMDDGMECYIISTAYEPTIPGYDWF